MPKFSSGRAAVMWAWVWQFDTLGGSPSFDPDQMGTGSTGNIKGALAAAINIKIWLERSAYLVGLESINPVLLRVLPQEQPINMPGWMERKADDALAELEKSLEKAGWLEKTCIISREMI